MTASIHNRRIDEYGPVEPWRMMKLTDQQIVDTLSRMVAAGVLVAGATPTTVDDTVFAVLDILLKDKGFLKAFRAVAEALPQHRPAVVQQLFAEGM